MKRISPVFACTLLLLALAAPGVALVRAQAKGLLLEVLTYDQARARTRENPGEREHESEALRLANFAAADSVLIDRRDLPDLLDASRWLAGDPRDSRAASRNNKDRDQQRRGEARADASDELTFSLRAALPPPHALHSDPLQNTLLHPALPSLLAGDGFLLGGCDSAASPHAPRAPPRLL